MTQNLYAIYDKVAEEAVQILTAKNDGIITRIYLGMIKNQPIETYIDLEVYRIGIINMASMEILHENPQPLKIQIQTENESKGEENA